MIHKQIYKEQNQNPQVSKAKVGYSKKKTP